MSKLNLVYALKNGKTTHISEVESGLKCECLCPACGEKLIAKKGSHMMHHFAHYTGHTCEYGYESSLHLAAKDIISNAKTFVIPSVYVEFPKSYKKKLLLCEAKEICVDDVRLEKRIGDIIPDIVIVSKGKEILVEIFVTHKIDDIKLSKIKKANISTIEINLSKLNQVVSPEELSRLLLNNCDEKVWVYNSVTQRKLHDFYKCADKRRMVSRGFALHVDNCPINTRIWKGKSYANFVDDCLYCEYCVHVDQDEFLCSGRLRVSKIEDFENSLENRITDSDKRRNEIKEKAISEGKCPSCGCRVVIRNGKYGDFFGCSNYPHCGFTSAIDKETGEIKLNS